MNRGKGTEKKPTPSQLSRASNNPSHAKLTTLDPQTSPILTINNNSTSANNSEMKTEDGNVGANGGNLGKTNDDPTVAVANSGDAKVVKPKLKVSFHGKTTSDVGLTERLRDHEAWRLKLNRPVPNDKKFKNLKKQWDSEKKFYMEEMKKSEDELINLFVTELHIDSLQRSEIVYLFEKYRLLRELLMRLRNIDCLKLFRVFLGQNDVGLAMDLISFIERDAMFLDFVDHDDYMIRGISNQDKECILKNIDLDPKNDEECDKWVSYILFLSNPATEFSRLRSRWEKMYLKFLDTGIVQSMINNDSQATWQLIRWKLPESVKENPECRANISAVCRADRSFSSYRKNSCPDRCDGHRGKLLLLLIRLRQLGMVDLALSQGISIASQCCSGQIRCLYWDYDRKASDANKPDKPAKKSKKGKASRGKVKLRAEYEYETPLSTAVQVGDLQIVKELVKRGASPLQSNDAAIRAGIKTVLSKNSDKKKKDVTDSTRTDSKKKKNSGKDDNDVLLKLMKDNHYIFNLIVELAKRNLDKSAKNKKGLIPPNYCTVSLIYQAVSEELWEAEEILTKVKTKRDINISSNTLEKQTGQAGVISDNSIKPSGSSENNDESSSQNDAASVNQTLQQFNIKNSLQLDDGTLKSTATRKRQIKGKRRQTEKSQGKNTAGLGSTIDTLKRGSLTNAKIGSKILGGISNTLLRKKKSQAQMSVASGAPTETDADDNPNAEKSDTKSIYSYFSSYNAGENEVEFSPMNEDLCYILVRVIDKLLDDLNRENSATHSRALNGIITLLEKHELYLDEDRFYTLLKSVVKVMQDARVGDVEAVTRLFRNSQFRDYLNFEIDHNWKLRKIEVFIRHDMVRRMLKLKRKGQKGRPKLAGLEDSRENMLEAILLNAARLNMNNLLVDLIEQGVKPDRDYVKEVMIAATKEEALETMETVVTTFGKYLLKFAFEVALSQSLILGIQKILQLDTEMDDKSFSLVESYIGNALLKRVKPKKISEMKNQESLTSVTTTSAHHEDQEKTKDEDTDDPTTPPVEIVLDFFFICTNMTKEKIIKILTECFKSGKDIDFLAVAHLLVKSTEAFPDLVPKELLDIFMDTKEVQYDGKGERTQVLWLQLLLDLYKCAANSDLSVEKEYNDRVIHLLELKGEHFNKFMGYESDHEPHEHPELLEQSELL